MTDIVADPEVVFGDDPDNYDKSRIGYPKEFVKQVLQDVRSRRFGHHRHPCIVDMGAGTGRLGRIFLELGCNVIFVEPNSDSLEWMKNEFGNNKRATFIQAHAQDLELPDGIADAIVMGDSAHWIQEEALPNLRRILKPGGSMAAFSRFWSQDLPITEKVHELLSGACGQKYENTIVQFLRSPENLALRLGKHLLNFEGKVGHNYTFFQEYDKEELMNYFRSCSFSTAAIHRDAEGFKRDVIGELWKFAVANDAKPGATKLLHGDRIRIPYEVNVLYEAPRKVRKFTEQVAESRRGERGGVA